MLSALCNLQQKDFNKIEKLLLNKSSIKKLKICQHLQNNIKGLAPNIKYLRFKSLESLNSLAYNNQFDLKDFINLLQLSISCDQGGTPNEKQTCFYSVFEHLRSPQKMQQLYLDLESFGLNIDQINQISTKVPKLTNLESLRLELGHNQIKPEGCQQIVLAISRLIQLKELILGLENNELGNSSLKQVFQMISQLQNLEKLQIDFWGNQSNDDAYEEIYEILKNSEVCRNLKEVRIFCWADDTKNPIKLIKSFSLFTNLTKLSFSVDLCDISQEIAIGLNQILQQNKQTLKTVIIFFKKNIQETIDKTSNQIQEIFKQINELAKLENLFIQFHSKQSYNSALDFFIQIKESKLLRLAIPTKFSELSDCSFSQTIHYFKKILDVQYLLKIEYINKDEDLHLEWYDQFFQQNWSISKFIDINLVSSFSKDKQKQNKFLNYIQKLSNHYAGDANSFESQNIFGNNDCCQECQEGENIENQDDDDDEEEAEEQEQENADFNQRQINQQHFNMDRKKLDMYLIVLEHYDFKMRELIILTAYYKSIKQKLQSQFDPIPNCILNNAWDLYLQ